jgi:hypothetical protein
LVPLAAWEYAAAIGNACGVAHAKYAPTPCLERPFYDQLTQPNWKKANRNGKMELKLEEMGAM